MILVGVLMGWYGVLDWDMLEILGVDSGGFGVCLIEGFFVIIGVFWELVKVLFILMLVWLLFGWEFL